MRCHTHAHHENQHVIAVFKKSKSANLQVKHGAAERDIRKQKLLEKEKKI